MSGAERKRDVVEAPENRAGDGTSKEISQGNQVKSPEQIRQDQGAA